MIAAPWSTVRASIARPISWRHWGETGTVCCGVHSSSPDGATPISPGPCTSGLFGRCLPSLKNGPQVCLWLWRPRPRPVSESPCTRSRYAEGAASIQQLPELESGKAATAETLPLVYGSPGTCWRQYRHHHRTGQKAQAGHPEGRPCPSLWCQTGSTINVSPLPPELP